MISNVNKNVVFVKNIPSNIIEEAIFILKEDVSDTRIDDKLDIAKNEAEMILQDYIDNEIVSSLKKKNEVTNKKIKLKKALIIMLCAFALIIGVISKGI
ncbi:MAG: hypothetical protein IJX99_07560 [Clostridia bacterium]|nr:hypothetical protein [Clostridia bacterium]